MAIPTDYGIGSKLRLQRWGRGEVMAPQYPRYRRGIAPRYKHRTPWAVHRYDARIGRMPERAFRGWLRYRFHPNRRYICQRKPERAS